MTKRAQKLRREMTPEECHLWYDFLRTYPIRFMRQRIIDGYIVDFYCASAKLVIEIDGAQHYEPEALAYDEERTRILNAYGLTVLRFRNSEINRQFQAVCQKIDQYILQYGSNNHGGIE